MNVKELIEQLRSLPPNLLVGYPEDDGYFSEIEEIKIESTYVGDTEKKTVVFFY